MRDKYNLNTLPPGVMPEDAELLDDHPSHANIPGMGPEDKIGEGLEGDGQQNSLSGLGAGMIPGLDVEPSVQEVKPMKKVPYAKPIPRNFQAQWNENPGKKPAILPTPMSTEGSDDEEGLVLGVDPVAFGMEQLGRATLTLFGLPASDPDQMRELLDSVQSLPVAHLPTPTAVIVDNTILPIQADSELEKAIRSGEEELTQCLNAMGLKVTPAVDEDESETHQQPEADHPRFNRDQELDDEDAYPRAHTPVLDDFGYNKGHSGIGPMPTGGLLGDFPPRGIVYFISQLRLYCLEICIVNSMYCSRVPAKRSSRPTNSASASSWSWPAATAASLAASSSRYTF